MFDDTKYRSSLFHLEDDLVSKNESHAMESIMIRTFRSLFDLKKDTEYRSSSCRGRQAQRNEEVLGYGLTALSFTPARSGYQ